MKAIALLSGGLDSILATRLILDQSIEVEALYFLTAFCACTSKEDACLASKSASDNLGIKLKIFEIGREYFEIIKRPKYGYGSNINPCIDCRIFMFKKAAEYMKTSGASFIFTGEVLGQRPMSQRKDAMNIIERDSGLKGMIVRPLSAGLMEETIAEKNGWIKREKLLSISGRSRKPQIKLAKEFGIKDYPGPAGGCLLTDPGFAIRMRDLIKHTPHFTTNDVELLKVGRYFRLGPEVKLVVGRNEKENDRLLSIAKDSDMLFFPADEAKGPVGVGRGVFSATDILKASRIIARYCDLKNCKIKISYKLKNGQKDGCSEILPIEEEKLNALRI